uniref:Sidoreflexin n=1 Tax=Spongospora subterranea TaxID=70186 RepID=A0A0H5R959_9EUKA|eukprot:CRZ10663.1 hypothetical protein [Spongospora subterranea]
MSADQPFSLSRDRYDQATYLGRVKKFIDIINPRNLFVSEEQLSGCKAKLQQFEKTGDASDQSLWEARSVVEAVVHPDTGKPIPILFRFSAFVPVNLPICVGMLTTTTVPGTIFWQWVNQSYNVAVNHSNRNASNAMSNEQILKAYTGAVLASCSISVGLNQIAKRANMKLLGQFTPFIAVATAGALNVVLMRRNELDQGIEIKDSEGNVCGKSKAAGRAALTQVALTRVALPAPILIIPPIIMNALKNARMIPTGRYGKLIVETGVVTACLAMAVPLAIGIFPQTGIISVQDLEEEFQNVRDSKGDRVSVFTYNKGL